MEADHATARAVCGAVIVPCDYLPVDCGVAVSKTNRLQWAFWILAVPLGQEHLD